MRWRWHVLMGTGGFIVTWTIFAAVYLIIAHAHGDLEHHGNVTWSPCMDNVYDFRTALLFSLETQSTIGYGYRVMQPECPVLIYLLMMQSCCGVAIAAVVTGLIFAKMARPTRRGRTIMFSRRATICRRDAEYQLLFRVGDMRRAHMIGTSLRAMLVRDHVTPEGERIPLSRQPLALETDSVGFVFLVWPVTVVHRISDETSPLWMTSAATLKAGARFEIVVIMEGVIESTGMLAQIRTSYTSDEILWGERLCPLMTYQSENGRYEIDYSHFHRTVPAPMPDCSASEWAAARRAAATALQVPGDPLSSPLSDPGTSAAIGRRSWTDEDVVDYSISFTVQSQPATRTTSSSVWKLFNRRHQRQTSSDGWAAAAADGDDVVALRRSKTDDGSTFAAAAAARGGDGFDNSGIVVNAESNSSLADHL
jgi:potassium inwardly-rectifying channel subfamily J